MALVLKRRLGESLTVGVIKITVINVLNHTKFIVAVNNKDAHSKHTVSEAKSVLVAPDVYISAGVSGNRNVARLAITAPKVMRVTRL